MCTDFDWNYIGNSFAINLKMILTISIFKQEINNKKIFYENINIFIELEN